LVVIITRMATAATQRAVRFQLNGIRRCGISYVANCLRSSGVPAADISVREDCFTDHSDAAGKILRIHVVRNPLAAIASLRTLSDAEWEYLIAPGLLPRVVMKDSPLKRAMRYWYDGNKFERRRSDRTVRLESLSVGEFKTIFDVDVEGASLAEQTEKGRPKVTTWGCLKMEDIHLANPVADLARQYGYDAPQIEHKSGCQGCI
jgi:hypothetical protein